MSQQCVFIKVTVSGAAQFKSLVLNHKDAFETVAAQLPETGIATAVQFYANRKPSKRQIAYGDYQVVVVDSH